MSKTDIKNIEVEINGINYAGSEGETILQIARREGIEIPTLCNDPRLEPYSSCYLCVVEVEGMRGHQPSCSTKVNSGMKVVTDNDAIAASRKTALDLIMSNHYADCQAPCKDTCPAGVDVQGYISLIDKGMYSDAVALIKETNPLPAICGRVCVRPCEAACRRNLLDEGAPVGIDYMKRFASDYDLESENKWVPEIKSSTGKRVAVIGAGPGGLSAAHFLQIEGHQVDIFEANAHSGGWLRYGIPEYRLPNDLLDKEVENITDLGVNINYNQKFGENLSYKDIKAQYDSTILTIGSQKGTLIGTEGDDAKNVFSGIDFLRNMEVTGQKMDFKGKTIAVVGGGNTAMDCCRTSIRCNADKVYVIYRRTEAEMPANPIEIHESKLEGVEYLFLTNPSKVNKDEDGVLKSVTLLKMELGEPDASGRRRPVPVEGSEFELPVDYILAAIGQKTNVDFIENINQYADDGELDVNRWGDIDADKETLQTGIKSVFAAGDGVTGAATIIEAIAQAKTAAYSCNQFLNGEKVQPPRKEFLSKKDNFKNQIQDEYAGKYAFQTRQEMPVLDADARFNFEEVELGYASEEVCRSESQRCMECGCVEYFDCDLKKFSTEYEADQTKFAGEYHEHKVDFRHPFIEIDNNKCILCSRCVRMCKEVVGANALGLVNRGFDTLVAPSMNLALTDTNCESCGLCISTCPTGAISENFKFKPGPVVESSAESVCNYCSLGCTVDYKHHNEFVMKVKGAEGMINSDTNICQKAKFGYNYLNDEDRIKTPLKKNANGEFEQVSWNEAYNIIKEKIGSVKADENFFSVSSRSTNEEMYLVQKLARAAVKTNNVHSFSNFDQGISESFAAYNVEFDQIDSADKVYILGSSLVSNHNVLAYKIFNAHHINKIAVSVIGKESDDALDHKYTDKLDIKSYYHFFRAANYYFVKESLENMMFISQRVDSYQEYKESLMSDEITELLDVAGVSLSELATWVRNYNNEQQAIIVFDESLFDRATITEIRNLSLVSGKLGKTACGLISLQSKNNSQGLIDMGINPSRSCGDSDLISSLNKMKAVYNIDNLNTNIHDVASLLDLGVIKNAFIFGEDPIGCAESEEKVQKLLSGLSFILVQDYFMTETAKKADLILPASFQIETGGSYTNTQKKIQSFDKVFKLKTDKDNVTQLLDLCLMFGINGLEDVHDVNSEIIKFLEAKENKLYFSTEKYLEQENLFKHSCDYLEKRFDEEFYSELK